MPVFRVKGGKLIRVNFRRILENKGFVVKRGPIMYKGQKSKLLREIWVFGRR